MRLPWGMIATLIVAMPAAGRAADAKPETPTPKERPNVIFILADDLGYNDLGCYGQKKIKTPNIDALAESGTRFTQAYAGSAVCAPSRCALLTGYHMGHAYIRGNKEIEPEGQAPLPPTTPTVAKLFKEAGYTTGLIGKWGLGGPASGSEPQQLGFDYFFGYLCQRKSHEYYPEYLWRNGQKVMLIGRQYSHDLMAADALDFVRRRAKKPFFLYLAYTIPHTKLQVPSIEPYSDESWPEEAKKLAAMITRMDTDIGKLMDLLEDLGIDNNTLVFFASDNGTAYEDKLFNHGGALRGMNRDLYEGGIRVPMIARWPKHIPAGKVSNQVWAFWDFLPTVAELLGQPAPPGVDGISMLPALLGKPQVSHEYLYWEFHERGFAQAVREGDWKAVRLGTKKPIELYNLKKDLEEKHDVAAENPDVVARLEARLKSARTDSTLFPIQEKAEKKSASAK